MVTVTRLRLQEAQSVAQMLDRRHVPARLRRRQRRARAIRTRPSSRTAACGRSSIRASAPRPAIRYVLYATVVRARRHAPLRTARRPPRARRWPASRTSPSWCEGGTIEQLKAVLRGTALRGPASRSWRVTSRSARSASASRRCCVRNEIRTVLKRAASTALIALILSTFVATLLAQWMLRPIHVIQSGLSRLGRGELDVALDLPGDEFRDLGTSFDAISAQLSAVRDQGAAGLGNRLRVGDGQPRRRDGAVLAGRRPDVRQLLDAGAAAVAGLRLSS